MTTHAPLVALLLALAASPAFADSAEAPPVLAPGPDAPGDHTRSVFDEERGLRIVCAPLLVCDIALEPGEVITDFATGDSKDWFVQNFTAGPDSTPHVILKPQDYELSTNLIVATNRRTYHFHLVSPTEAATRAKGFHYDRLVSFTYPAATLQHLAAAAPPAAVDTPPAAPPAGRCGDPTCWHDRYRVSAGRFAPLRVLDDGEHVFMKLSSHEAPALFEVLADGSTAPLNYRYSADSRWIIVDRLFDSARLVLRMGRREATATIERMTTR